MVVGILALQGSFAEHQNIVKQLNVNTLLVKTIDELNKVDGLIIPGGESTTIGKLLKIFNLFEPLKEKIKNGFPVYGTCAGLILLAAEIIGENPHLGLINIKVKRNAYGRQLSSFSCNTYVDEFKKEIPLVFIRAPWIESVNDPARIILELDGKIVCARQENILVTSFHPELTNDTTVHEYFLKMIEEYKK